MNFYFILIGLLAGGAAVGLFMEFRHRIALLDARILVLEAASQKRMNYRTLEEIEDAIAAIDALDSELDFKRTFLDNAKAHLFKARNPQNT